MTEADAVRQAIEAGDAYGYGHIIAHLNTAWARMLMKEFNIAEQDARFMAHGYGYPFDEQDRLLESRTQGEEA